MTEELGLKSDAVGIAYGILNFMYMGMCPIIAVLGKKLHNNRLMITCGVFMIGCALLFICPKKSEIDITSNNTSKTSSLPKELKMIYSGLAIMGFFQPFVYLPMIPEFFIHLEAHFTQFSKEQLSDISSALFNVFLSSGSFVGPLFGGTITHIIGFRAQVFLISGILLCYCVFYYITTKVWEGKKDYEKISLKVPDYQEEIRMSIGKSSLIYNPSIMTRKSIIMHKISEIKYRTSSHDFLHQYY